MTLTGDQPTTTILRMADVAARLGVSVRWLQGYLAKNPCGRRAGRSRIFTEADFTALVAGLPRNAEKRPSRVRAGRRRRAVSIAPKSDAHTWAELQALFPERKRSGPRRPGT